MFNFFKSMKWLFLTRHDYQPHYLLHPINLKTIKREMNHIKYLGEVT